MRKFAVLTAMALALAASEACAARGGYVVGMAPPPPPAYAGYIGRAPGPHYVWVPGFWAWRGGWQWVAGRWAVPPRPRAAWVPGYWAPRHHGYVWTEGYWR